MTHPGRAVWEGIKWFIIAFFVVALGIAPAGIFLVAYLDAPWLAYPCYLLAAAVFIWFPTSAIRHEVRMQKYLCPDPATKNFEDEILGTLVRSEDEKVMWETQFTSDTESIAVRIFGEGVPDESLLASARQLRESFSDFGRQVTAFKTSRLAADPLLRPFADEVWELKVETICFFDPENPTEADVFYSGGLDGHSWHGGMVAGKLTGLSFDT